MKLTRRQFVRNSAVGAAGILAYKAALRSAFPFSQSPTNIRKFVTGLPGLNTPNELGNSIPIAVANTTRYRGTDFYDMVIRQFSQRLHPDLPNPTTFWGYAQAGTPVASQQYLGPLIVATRDRPVKMRFTNMLPNKSIVPIDTTVMDPALAAAFGAIENRTAVHLHGGLVYWHHDGGPFAWWTPGAEKGSSFMNGTGVNGQALYDYPNGLSARLVWYHDHAYGITRTNAYAGIAAGYYIADGVLDAGATSLVGTGLVPNLGATVPLILQDKTFFDPDKDPNYPITGAVAGSLWYPWIYEGTTDPNQLPSMALPPVPPFTTFRLEQADAAQALPIPSCIPEFFADTLLVNGAPYPYLNVDAKRYRFLILNGTQARFYNLHMYVADPDTGNLPPGVPTDGVTLAPYEADIDPNGNPILAPSNAAGPAFIQIGTEGGILPAPVVFGDPVSNTNSNLPMGFDLDPLSPTSGNANRYNLLMAPAERADIIVDFRGFEGKTIVLYTDAPAPFPGGDTRNDYYTGDFDLSMIGGAPPTLPGYGPNSRTFMIFKVGSNTSGEMSLADTLTALQSALPIAYANSQPADLPTTGLVPQPKTLNEDFDSYGRLRQRIGTISPTGTDPATGLPTFGMDFTATPTETAKAGDSQIWTLFNLSGDTHPLHFHLVNVQVLQRQPFFQDPVTGALTLTGVAHGPDPNERGWKETVRMNPLESITVIMKFDLPKPKVGPPPKVPFSPRLQASYGVNAYEYVWHCHILEHEEHDMMRPLVILP